MNPGSLPTGVRLTYVRDFARGWRLEVHTPSNRFSTEIDRVRQLVVSIHQSLPFGVVTLPSPFRLVVVDSRYPFLLRVPWEYFVSQPLSIG